MNREQLQSYIALLASFLLHGGGFGCWYFRETLSDLKLVAPLVRALQDEVLPAPIQDQLIPTLTFVEVQEQQPQIFMETSEQQTTGEEPQNAEYYSDKPTIASNPENPVDELGETPYTEGQDTQVVSSHDVVPDDGPPELPTQVATVVTPPVPPIIENDIHEATPGPEPLVDEVTKDPKERDEPAEAAPDVNEVVPEQIAELTQKIVEPITPQMNEEPPQLPALQVTPSVSPSMPTLSIDKEIVSAKGQLTASGVEKLGITAFNVASSPFGSYDQKIIKAVQSRWYALIRRYGIYERAGSVTLNFALYDDGTVQNLSRLENTAGEILALYCEKAIIESAPFERLPDSLRVLVGKDPREVNFTFYY